MSGRPQLLVPELFLYIAAGVTSCMALISPKANDPTDRLGVVAIYNLASENTHVLIHTILLTTLDSIWEASH